MIRGISNLLEEDPHAEGLFFFLPSPRESAVRSYQTPSPREYGGGPFSCLIYSDKSFRGNGYNAHKARSYSRERGRKREFFVYLVHLRISLKCFEILGQALVDPVLSRVFVVQSEIKKTRRNMYYPTTAAMQSNRIEK